MHDDEDTLDSIDPVATEAADTRPVWTVSSARFQAGLAARWLSPAERAAIARRPRFHSMPWLAPAGQPRDPLP